MPKIDVNKVAEILQHNQLPPEQLRRIIEEINEATRERGEEKPPAVKKQWVILVSDPDAKVMVWLNNWDDVAGAVFR